MTGADQERWDARHAALGPAHPAPPDALRGLLHLLPHPDGRPVPHVGGTSAGGVLPGGAPRALDVACGRGAVALWLRERGFAVDAVDVSPVAVSAGRAAADDPANERHSRPEGVDESAARSERGGVVRWHLHDLDSGLPPDCVGPYDVVVCQRFRDARLYPALLGALGPGGLLVVTVLSQVGDAPGAFRAAPGELRAAFGDLTVLVDEERDGLATLVATRPVADRHLE